MKAQMEIKVGDYIKFYYHINNIGATYKTIKRENEGTVLEVREKELVVDDIKHENTNSIVKKYQIKEVIRKE